MPNITENPDYQLVMNFLQNIRPGDMDEESSQQLMAIGQRIQGGGALTDREREMFKAVVGEMGRFPTEQMGSFPQGNTNPDIMKDPSMGAMSEGEMRLAMDTAMPTNLTPEQMDQFMAQKNNAVSMGSVSDSEMQMAQDSLARLGLAPMTEEEMMSYQVDGQTVPMTQEQYGTEMQSGNITPNMQMRPQARPMMTSPRPQMRR